MKINPNRLPKFEKWLRKLGCEIIPCTNEHEALRFKGNQVGVVYKTGSTSGAYTNAAFNAFQNGNSWSGSPKTTKRMSRGTSDRRKKQLISRDGKYCFYCSKKMPNNDITKEHLVELSQGGKNSLGNMVLAHQKCNEDVKGMSVKEKLNFTLKIRGEKADKMISMLKETNKALEFQLRQSLLVQEPKKSWWVRLFDYFLK